MPVYNGEKYLAEAIESILNQTYQDYEFLIINDGSTDNSMHCIESYNDLRIRVINNEKNFGLVRTLNIGLNLAKGRYIARFDQDDISLPSRLKSQLELLENNDEISAVCSWMYTINSDGRKIRDFTEKIDNYGDFLGIILLGRVPLYHPAVMFNKEMVLKLNGYDTKYQKAEDYDLWRRMALSRHNAKFIPDYHLLIRNHNERATNVHLDGFIAAGKKIHEETIEMFCKHKDIQCLAALMRLEQDPCGKRYERRHIRDISSALDELITCISKNMSLSHEEIVTLKVRIYKRLGLGVRYGVALSNLPSFIYNPLFFSLSPLLMPKLHFLLSKIVRKLQEAYFRINIFK